MISINTVSVSCGLRTLGGEILYKTAETYFKDLARLMTKPNLTTPHHLALNSLYTVYIFSHSPDKNPIGGLITKYIEKHNLGSVTVSPTGNNPVHDSKIVVYVWVRDNDNFLKHCKELLCIVPPPKTVEPITSTESVSSPPAIPNSLSGELKQPPRASHVIATKRGRSPASLSSQMPDQLAAEYALKVN